MRSVIVKIAMTITAPELWMEPERPSAVSMSSCVVTNKLEGKLGHTFDAPFLFSFSLLAFSNSQTVTPTKTAAANKQAPE